MLALLFAVFNIGLPIVVASCPMTKFSDSLQCMMCDDGSDATSQRISNFVDKSCCETKYAADRNTNEFLQEHSKGVELTKIIPAISAHVVFQSPVLDLQFQFVSASPPRSVDIPIFNSTLRI